MSLNLSVGIKNSRLQAICDAIDAQPSTLTIFTSDESILCQLDFPTPCKGSIENGVLTFANLTEQMVLIDGVASHAKILTDTQELIANVSIGSLDSFAVLRLPSTTQYSGSLLRVNGWTITEP